MKRAKILLIIIFTIFSFGLFQSVAKAASDEVIVVVVPSAPTISSATPNCSGSTSYITISWGAVASATNYVLVDNSTNIYSGSATSYTHSGLTSGSSHSYYVYASNSYGTSAYSATVSATAATCGTNYIVSTSAGTGGSFSPTSRTVASGASTTFTVTPSTNYIINSVTGCGGSLSGSTYTTGAITANCTVTATFTYYVPTTYYTVSTSAGTGGSFNPTSRSVASGLSTTFAVIPSANYIINSVTGCGGSLSGTTYNTGIITANCTVTATFTYSPQQTSFTVSGYAEAGGSISPASQTVASGSTTSLSVVANAGYSINSVSGCGGYLSSTTFFTGAITANCTVTATFIESSSLGYITPASSTCIIPAGSDHCTGVNITWEVYSYSGTSYVSSGKTVVYGHSGSQLFPVYYGYYTFYLFNNDNIIAENYIFPSCASGTVWNGRICLAINSLTVTRLGNGSGNGWVSSSPSGISCGGDCSESYYSDTSLVLTEAPGAGNVFSGWGGDCSGTGTTCNLSMTTPKSVTANFSLIAVSVSAGTPYYVAPSASVTFNYVGTSNNGTAACRLLDNNQSALTSYQTTGSISYTIPSNVGAYGYYVQCQDTVATSVTGISSLITVNAVSVSVSASTPYNTTPGTNVSFAYTPSATAGSTECALLNSSQTIITPYQSASPIVYSAPSAIGSFGYYVRCRHVNATAVTATSGLITMNTACSASTSWDGSACVLPTGTLSAASCSIPAEGSSCSTSLTWSTTYPIGTSAVTTNPSNTIVATANSGSGVAWTVPYPSKDFYLYNNSNLLSQVTANASCTSGTVWNSTEGKCKSTTGTLETTGCTISDGNSTCLSNLSWNTTNPTTISIVKNATTGATITWGNTGSQTYSVGPGVTNFALWHNGVVINTASSTATCASMTEWNGTTCALVPPEIDTFSASSGTIFEGRSATLTWTTDPDLVSSCTGTGFSTGGLTSGSVTVTPTATTTYSLTCARGEQSVTETLTVKVINLIIKEQ